MCGSLVNIMVGASEAAKKGYEGYDAMANPPGPPELPEAQQSQKPRSTKKKQASKKAKHSAYRDANRSAEGANNLGSTLLTGPMGADLSSLNLGSTSLLGR